MSENKVYVLLLENNKYYIGKTTNIVNRIIDHYNGSGAKYTKKYGINDLVEIKTNSNLFEEENTVIEYMHKYGIDNVRGGIYCAETLTDNQITDIKRKIASVYNLCYNCNNPDHYTKTCPYIYSNKIISTNKAIETGNSSDVIYNITEIENTNETTNENIINDFIAIKSNEPNNTTFNNLPINYPWNKKNNKKYGKRWTVTEEKLLLDKLKNGKKYQEIGSELGRSYGAIQSRVVHLIKQYYKNKESVDAISNKMYLNKAYVQTIINNFKIN